MNQTAYPVVDGVPTLVGAPDGYRVDFAHPQQHFKLAHYLIFSLMCPLALVTLGQRLYTKLRLSTGLKLDDGVYHRLCPSRASQAGVVSDSVHQVLICVAWLFSVVMQSVQICKRYGMYPSIADSLIHTGTAGSIAIGGLCHHVWEMPLDVYKKNMVVSFCFPA